MANRLVAYSDVQDFLGLSQAENNHPELTLIINHMTGVFEQYLHRQLVETSRTENFFGRGTIVPLKALPINLVNLVTLTEGTSTTTLTSNDYTILDNMGIRLLNTQLTGEVKATVTYTGGYTTQTNGSHEILQVPDELKHASLYQIAYEFQNKDQVDAQTLSTGAGSVSRPPLRLAPYVASILDQFKHPWVLA